MLFVIWDDLLTCCYYWELMTSKEEIKVLWQCVSSPWAATDDPSTCRECLLSGGGSVFKKKKKGKRLLQPLCVPFTPFLIFDLYFAKEL